MCRKQDYRQLANIYFVEVQRCFLYGYVDKGQISEKPQNKICSVFAINPHQFVWILLRICRECTAVFSTLTLIEDQICTKIHGKGLPAAFSADFDFNRRRQCRKRYDKSATKYAPIGADLQQKQCRFYSVDFPLKIRSRSIQCECTRTVNLVSLAFSPHGTPLPFINWLQVRGHVMTL